MVKPPYWNHNIAYYNRIKLQTANCNSILDVGCGNGLLLRFLNDYQKLLTGIDIDFSCIDSCKRNTDTENTEFIQGDFLTFECNHKYDAVIFVASIHHFDMESALIKAKSLLNDNGKLIIVGLSKPSGLMDYIVEIMRIIPVKLISAIKKSKSSESLCIPVSYSIPTMRYVRKTKKKLLPDSHLKYGLYYRYYLTWINK